MLPSNYALHTTLPTPDEFCNLRVLAGMSTRSAEGAAIGLPNTFFAVTVRAEGRLVGMGRIVGDGGLSFQLVDICVDPEHQGRGLGKAIVARLVDHLSTAPAGSHISLQADGPARYLYAKYGFVEIAPAAIGMELPAHWP